MADGITDFFNNFLNGETAGVPNIMLIAFVGMIFFAIYLYMTRKPKAKEFKPLDLKKETKRRFKKDYKYFGKSLGKNIYDANDDAKPIAFAIGVMKIVENKRMKRLEPIYTTYSKTDLIKAKNKTAKEIYGKDYLALSENEKRNVHEVAKEELRNEQIQIAEKGADIKFVRGKKEIEFSEPIPMYAFKICGTAIVNKILARLFNYGIDWFVLEKEQVNFEPSRITLSADFQRRKPNEVFVFSKAGKKLVQDVSYEVERENIWQETANQIPRAVHFDTEASKSLVYRREDAKLEREKRRGQKESREFG